MKYKGDGIGKLHVCAQCGQPFMVPYQSKGGGKTCWVYRKRIGKKQAYYCSYHCFRNEETIYDGSYS